MQDNNLDLGKNYLQDLATQLNTIFDLAPGKHEIRIIGRWHEVHICSETRQKCLLEEKGDRAQGYSIGLASSTNEAMQIITSHFSVDKQPLHNCFIVTNTVADDFTLSMKRGKIGSKWFDNMAYFLTKATDIVAINSIVIDIENIIA